MNNEIKDYLKDLAINKLMETEIGDKIEVAFTLFKKVQVNLCALSEKEGDELATLTKIYTIMTFSILKKFSTGKSPLSFIKDDWKDIANDVSEYAILIDDQEYVVFVFGMYEKYIRASLDYIRTFAKEKDVLAIETLADELCIKSEMLKNGDLEEVSYIEDCLWICLEAMLKLLSAMSKLIRNDEYSELVQALALYAFEYGRFVLYRQEQLLIDELIQQQYEIDIALQEKFDQYIIKLEEEANYFYTLIDNAFVPNFREQFLHSIVLAKVAGVDEREILNSVDDIDEFFMN